MTSEPTSAHPRYLTLRDYLRVLKRYAPAIIALAIIGAAAGLADALRQTDSYEATADIAFPDPSQALGLVGLASNSLTSPAQLAAVNADQATSPSILSTVQQRLGGAPSAASLEGSIATQITVTGLLQITASSSNPASAAKLANTDAAALVDQDNAQTRRQIANLAQQIQQRISAIRAAGSRSPGAAQLGFYADELARLQTLGAVASSAQITKAAEPPGSPASPHPTRSAIIGLALGLLLGILAAFLRDSLDRRLRSEGEIESVFALPILGRVRKQALGKVPQLGAGASKKSQIDLDNVRALRRNLDLVASDGAPRCFAVVSGVAGEGKTTVAASLAAAMAARGTRTLLVDCDLRGGRLAELFKLDRSPGLSDHLAGRAELDGLARTVSFTEGQATNCSIAFIAAGSAGGGTAELLGSARFEQFLDQARASYDAILLDTSPLVSAADTLEILGRVDGLLICVRIARTTEDEALAVRHAVARFPARYAGLVITGVTRSVAAYDGYS